MDEEIKSILKHVFPQEDVSFVEGMLGVVNRDMSDKAKGKRGNQLDTLLREKVK